MMSRSRAGRCTVALIVALAVALLAYPQLPDGLGAAAYLTVAVAAATVMRRASRCGRLPAGWTLLWAGIVCWIGGDAVWFALHGHPGWGGWVDLVYLPGYALLVAGLWRLTRTVASAGIRGLLLDGAVVALAGGWLLWQTAVAPAAAGSGAGFRLVLVASFPVLDLVMLLTAGRVALLAGRPQRSAQLLVAAFAVLLVADLGYILGGQHLPVPAGGLLDLAWLGFYGLLAAAASHPSAAALARSEASVRSMPLRAALVAPALLVVPGYDLAARWLDRPGIGTAGATVGLVIAGLVAVRLLCALADQARAQERQQAAEAVMRRRERQFRAVFEHAGIGMALNTAEGVIEQANGALEELLGREAEELRGRHFSVFTHPDDCARDEALYADLVAGGRQRYRLEKRFLRPDGSERWGRLTVTTAPWDEAGRQLYIGMVEDITEARANLERLELQSQLLTAVGEAIVATDLEGRVIYWNPAAERLFGWRGEEVLGRSMVELNVSEADREGAQGVMETVRGGRTWTGEFPVRRVDGGTFTALVTSSLFVDAEGRRAGIIGVSTDITEQKRTEERLERQARQQAAVARLGQEALGSANLTALASSATRLVRETLDVVDCTLDAAVGGDPRRGAGNVVVVPVAAHGTLHGRLLVQLGVRGPLDRDDRSFLQAVANVLAAAFEDEAAQRRLEHQALHDPLTGLPNRTLFFDRVEAALRRQEQGGGRVAVLFADLDEFKLVNDGLGHTAGDEVLVTMARRMQRALRPGDTIARLGGDEFAVVCDPVRGEADAEKLARRLLGTLTAPFPVTGHELVVTASVGAAVGGAGDDPEALLRDADIAMYRAKALGRNRYALFDEGLREAAYDRLGLHSALRHALARDELRLVYQPELDLVTGEVVIVEALMRWDHPTRGAVPPSEFIPVAEEIGVIGELGAWALETACTTAASWSAPGALPPAVAVNLSPMQLEQPDLCEVVAAALERSGLPACRLWLEVTEGAVMRDPEAAVTALERLKRLGVRIAIDDFGTGYSSLAHLRAFPLDALKIDRSFVDGVGSDRHDHCIVAAIVQLARALDLQSVAEGVETESQLAELRALGCDIGQGYHWSRPVEPDRLRALLAGPTANGNGQRAALSSR